MFLWYFLCNKSFLFLVYCTIINDFTLFSAKSGSIFASHFDYSKFFDEKIAQKKADHSYRIFKKVNRLAKDFPCAEDFSNSEDIKKVTVWCSNDYLGMSRHQDVVQVAKYVDYI